MEDECYLCALGPADKTEAVIYRIEGERKTVSCCIEHYSAVVWASMPGVKIHAAHQIASR